MAADNTAAGHVVDLIRNGAIMEARAAMTMHHTQHTAATFTCDVIDALAAAGWVNPTATVRSVIRGY